MSRDPIGYTDCISLFEYVWDSPANWIDPTGNQMVPGTPNSPYNPYPIGSYPVPTLLPIPPVPPPERVLVPLPGDPPLPGSGGPGGTWIPGTHSFRQNCFGDSLGTKRNINWPGLGKHCDSEKWVAALEFVPIGCKAVSCDGIDVGHTYCLPEETELVLFLYRWPDGSDFTCDFHMVGRTCRNSKCSWHSKADQRQCIVDITDPLQSCYDAYGRTKWPNTTLVKKCFCCDQKKMRIKREKGRDIIQ